MYIIFEVPICMSVVVRKVFVIAQNYRPSLLLRIIVLVIKLLPSAQYMHALLF
jgi:hypothetical protein